MSNTRLEKIYKDVVVPKMIEKFGYKNVMEVPRLSKITLNMGVGEAVGNKKILVARQRNRVAQRGWPH